MLVNRLQFNFRVFSPNSEEELSQQSYQCYQNNDPQSRQINAENAKYESAIRCGNKNCTNLQHIVHLQVQIVKNKCIRHSTRLKRI